MSKRSGKLRRIKEQLRKLNLKYVEATFIGKKPTEIRAGTFRFELLKNKNIYGYFFQNEKGRVKLPVKSLEGVCFFEDDLGGSILINREYGGGILGE